MIFLSVCLYHAISSSSHLMATSSSMIIMSMSESGVDIFFALDPKSTMLLMTLSNSWYTLVAKSAAMSLSFAMSMVGSSSGFLFFMVVTIFTSLFFAELFLYLKT